MKKQLLFGAILFGAIASANAQTTLFEDNFDSYDDFIIDNIGEWTMIDVDGAPTYGIEVGTPPNTTAVEFENSGYTGTAIIFNPSATDPMLDEDPDTEEGYEPHSGDRSLNFIAAVAQNVDDPTLTGPNNDWMITPQITLGSAGNTLTFWAKSLTDAYGLERIRVAVSTTGNTSTSDFTAISAGNYIQVPTEWTQYTYSLDTYAGQDVYIAINYVSDDAFILLTDDFLVTTSDTAGVNNNLASQFSVFPNPTANVINIANAENILVNGVAIVDVNGRTVKSVNFDGVSEAQVNIADLASGMYLMNISSDKGMTTKKIVKN